MSVKPAPTNVSIHELIAGRWSPRAYSNQPITREQLHSVLEAARWAPSAYNAQPWRFLTFDRNHDAASFDRAFATLVPFNQAWNAPAPVLIAVVASTLNAKGEPNGTALYDTGAAAMALVLQAHALGLAAHQMAGFDAQALVDAFGIPPEFKVISIISLAHYGDTATLDDTLREREQGPRVRQPIGEVAYEGAWQQAFSAD
jgi:nitroreductase